MRWPSQFLLFVVVGAIGYCVDVGITLALERGGWSPGAARIPGLLSAIVATWALNRRFSFALRSRARFGEFARYFGVALASAALNYVLFRGMIAAGLGTVAAITLATAVTMFVSFVGYRSVVFFRQ